MRPYSSLCFDFSCRFKWSFVVNFLSHFGHWNFFLYSALLCTVPTCRLSWYFLLKDLSHWSHLFWKKLPKSSTKSTFAFMLKCCSLRWQVKLSFRTNVSSHCSHLNRVVFKWKDLTCLWRLWTVDKTSKQNSHWNSSTSVSSLLVWLFKIW